MRMQGEWENAIMVLLKPLFFDFMGRASPHLGPCLLLCWCRHGAEAAPIAPAADQCGAELDPDCDGNNITAVNVISGTKEDGKNRRAPLPPLR